MSVSTEVKRLQQAKSDLKNAINQKIDTPIQDELLGAYHNKIEDVYEAGYEKGKAEGGGDNYYNTFWDSYQNEGNLTDYSYAFAGNGWTEENFKPKYKISPITASFMFYMSYNLCADLRDVDIVFSNCGNMQSTFRYSGVLALGIIDTTATTSSTSITAMLANCSNLHTIIKLILKENGSQTFSSFVQGCNKLANILVEGVIGKDISFQWCPLTKQSIKGKEITLEEYSALSDTVKANNVYIEDDKYYYGGIVTALSTTTSGTITFKKTAINQAFGIDIDDEATWTTEFIGLRNSKSNWTFSYV